MIDWQPIETAPRDERVLLWDGWWVFIGEDVSAVAPEAERCWLDESMDIPPMDPTHWAPLPNGPLDTGTATRA